MTESEKNYVATVSAGHLKRYGQYFTSSFIADFMCAWACHGADSVLDPAVGNSVFLRCARKRNQAAHLTGYEIDPIILEHFGNPVRAEILLQDYLLGGWERRFDSIVCNPPYGKFQFVANRHDIIDVLRRETGVRYSGYINLYAMFLLKSIAQMSDKGRLAYIIPSEFLNSRYGNQIKQLLIKKRLLKAIVNFAIDRDIFDGVTTTCCILFLDRTIKDSAVFYNIQSPDRLSGITIGELGSFGVCVPYGSLDPNVKWRPFLENDAHGKMRELVPVSTFCKVSRGIATGDNDFFCLTRNEVAQNRIPTQYLIECICKSSDVRAPFLGKKDFSMLVRGGKKTYVLDVPRLNDVRVANYLSKGVAAGVDKKYLPSLRRPWCSMERKKPAQILLSTACRKGLKVVRNLAGVSSLTTFHSLYVRPEYEQDVDLIFCYFLTPSAQKLLLDNRKNLGNGLVKFQPNDVNTADMIDIRRISAKDRRRIMEIYRKMRDGYSVDSICALDEIFSVYVK
ncbi:MAG: N-6 DNA methylase [Kiritimatiellae bacterium]|nr:N-6 DNA methylase [Kiritimatiellia bacterium]